MASEDWHTLEAADPDCLVPCEAEALLAGHPWRRFVVLGDSVAEGVGEPIHGYHPMAFPDRFAAELARARPDLDYLNLGERNLRAGQVRAGQLPEALAFRPDLALVVCGANDAMRPGYEARVDAVDRDLAAIVAALSEHGAQIITVSLFVMAAYPSLPSWLEPSFIRRMALLARRTNAVAAAHHTIHVDLSTHPAAADGGLTCSDGLHGNGRSQAIAAAALIRRVGAHLGNAFTPQAAVAATRQAAVPTRPQAAVTF